MSVADSGNIAIILLGGRSERFATGAEGSRLPKQFYSLKKDPEKPLFELTSGRLLEKTKIQQMLFVIPESIEQRNLFGTSLSRLQERFPHVIFNFTSGGKNRHESFEKGVIFLKDGSLNGKVLMIQDANRPFLSDEFLQRVDQETQNINEKKPCSVPIIPCSDSLVMSETDHFSYLPREKVYHIQTPQLLWGNSVLKAFQKKEEQEKSGALWPDEGSFMLEMGFPVRSYIGDTTNKKVTYYQDIS